MNKKFIAVISVLFLFLVPTLSGEKMIYDHAFAQENNEDRVPDWLKQVLIWWMEGKISDEEVANNIAHLVRENIISDMSQDSIPTEAAPEGFTIPTEFREALQEWAQGETIDQDEGGEEESIADRIQGLLREIREAVEDAAADDSEETTNPPAAVHRIFVSGFVYDEDGAVNEANVHVELRFFEASGYGSLEQDTFSDLTGFFKVPFEVTETQFISSLNGVPFFVTAMKGEKFGYDDGRTETEISLTWIIDRVRAAFAIFGAEISSPEDVEGYSGNLRTLALVELDAYYQGGWADVLITEGGAGDRQSALEDLRRVEREVREMMALLERGNCLTTFPELGSILDRIILGRYSTPDQIRETIEVAESILENVRTRVLDLRLHPPSPNSFALDPGANFGFNIGSFHICGAGVVQLVPSSDVTSSLNIVGGYPNFAISGVIKTPKSVGDYQITLTATETILSSQQTESVSIRVQNVEPIIESVGNDSGEPGDTIDIRAAVTDKNAETPDELQNVVLDGSALTDALENVNSELTQQVGGGTIIVTGTIKEALPGEYDLGITVDDKNGGTSNRMTAEIVVENVAPIIKKISVSPSVITPSETYTQVTVTVEFSDPNTAEDLNDLTLEVIPQGSGIDFTAHIPDSPIVTGQDIQTFTFQAKGDSGTIEIKATINDKGELSGTGNPATVTFENRPPNILIKSCDTIGTIVQISFSAEDPNNDPMTAQIIVDGTPYTPTATSPSPGITRYHVLVPFPATFHTFNVIFSVSDAEFTITDKLSCPVNPEHYQPPGEGDPKK